MTSKLGLLPEDIAGRIEELPARLAELHGLAAVWLFGSWARGEATPVSDVDLAYLPAADGDGEDAGLYRVVTKVLGTDEVTLADLRTLQATLADYRGTRRKVAADDGASATRKHERIWRGAPITLTGDSRSPAGTWRPLRNLGLEREAQWC